MDTNRCRDPQPNIRRSSGSLFGRVEDRIELARVITDTARRPTVLTNLGPGGSEGLNHKPKNMGGT